MPQPTKVSSLTSGLSSTRMPTTPPLGAAPPPALPRPVWMFRSTLLSVSTATPTLGSCTTLAYLPAHANLVSTWTHQKHSNASPAPPSSVMSAWQLIPPSAQLAPLEESLTVLPKAAPVELATSSTKPPAKPAPTSVLLVWLPTAPVPAVSILPAEISTRPVPVSLDSSTQEAPIAQPALKPASPAVMLLLV